MFEFTFHMKGGLTLKVICADDGLSMDEWRNDIEKCIYEELYYTTYDVIEDEWTVINAKKILAFSIKDVGPNYIQQSEEGFDFK